MDSIKDKEKASEKDSFNEYVRLKLSKLSAALYLVTNFLPDQEPVKWLLREKALTLVTQDLSQPLFGHLISQIEQILPPIELALLCPNVSKMNLNILKIEYLSLKQVLLDKHSHTQAALEQTPTLALSDSDPANYQKPKPFPSQTETARTIAPLASPRAGLILGLIRQKGPSSIRDIAGNVRGVSNKTVQRELAELVRAGRLVKEGEKRWSRYSLAR